MIHDLTVEGLEARGAGEQPIIIDFFASWCGPCKMLAPIFERVAEKCGDAADFAKVDIDEQPKLAEKFEIMTVPTIIALKGGEVFHKSSGIMNESALADLAARIAE